MFLTERQSKAEEAKKLEKVGISFKNKMVQK